MNRFKLRDENHPKTNKVEAGSGRVEVAGSYPAEDGKVVPRAAAQHTIRTCTGSSRVISRAVFVLIFIVPILAPLPDIAAHVVSAQLVG